MSRPREQRQLQRHPPKRACPDPDDIPLDEEDEPNFGDWPMPIPAAPDRNKEPLQ